MTLPPFINYMLLAIYALLLIYTFVKILLDTKSTPKQKSPL